MRHRSVPLHVARVGAAILLLAPRVALACPNCFGSTESAVYQMYQYSTVALSLLPFAIVGVIVVTVRRFARQADRGRRGAARDRRRGPARVHAFPESRPAAR